MSSATTRRWLAVAGAAAMTLPFASPAHAAVVTGPNTTTSPYVVPAAPGVDITSLLTVGDSGAADNGYEFVGIPDGIGAYRQGDKIITLVNHELTADKGVVRRHGQRGAFVSRLVLDPATGRVTNGSDLIDPTVVYWNYPAGRYARTASPAGTNASGKTFEAQLAEFARFCSGDLTTRGQLYNSATGRGFLGRLYFANEEAGDEGRLFGVTLQGKAIQLPRLGLFSWENTLAAFNRTDTTLVMGNEDTDEGQLWAYVGKKTSTGNQFDRAGLTNGLNSVLALRSSSVKTDAAFRETHGTNTPVPFGLRQVDWNQSGADQNAEALAKGLTLNRIEDGEFDPNNRNDYYFVTTDGGVGTGEGGGGGLWRASFDNIDQPNLGGTLTLLLDGSEGNKPMNKPDNVTIDRHGNLLIQEDPGGVDALARILSYRIDDGALGVVAQFDPARFAPESSDNPEFLTVDEESSGIVDAEALLGTPGAFFFDAQVHDPKGLPEGSGRRTVQEYVENGQLLKLVISDFSKVYANSL